jgi:hypothetical protein
MDLELDNRATATDEALMQHALKKDRKPVESKVFSLFYSRSSIPWCDTLRLYDSPPLDQDWNVTVMWHFL